MTEVDIEPHQQALMAHDAFEPGPNPQRFLITNTPFSASLTLKPTSDHIIYKLTITLPTLDASVANETIPPIIQEDWFNTLESRLTNIDGVTIGSTDTPLLTLDSETQTVTVELTLHVTDPTPGTTDATALASFVEGTYLSGTISGYEYNEPVASLLERARNQSTDPSPS